MAENRHVLSKSIEKEATPTTTAESSGPSVPLHGLCQNCQNFSCRWDVLKWLQDPHKEEDRTWPSSCLGSMAQLIETQGVCHLCKFVLGSMEERGKLGRRTLGDVNIYLCPRKKRGEVVCIHAAFGEEERVKAEDGEFRPSFKLGTYHVPKTEGFLSHVTARDVPLFAKDNTWKAKGWIETCLTEHSSCQQFHANTVVDRCQRPTRVLEVTAKAIRLRCDMPDERFNYLVLSHMWGPVQTHQLRLFKSNLADFQLDIPRAELEASSVFKEAIRVTLCLGYRYLWIDSLCIVQDSATDWEYEARRMAIVYGNAVCNLAFLFPPQGANSPKERDDPRTLNPCTLRPAETSRLGVYIEHVKSPWTWRQEFHEEEETKPWLVQRNWPLFQRAWTFQEYLLSPRTLLLGHQNLMWHCSEHFYDELLGPIAETHQASNVNPKRGKDRAKSRYFPESINSIATATTLSAPSVLSFVVDWQNLINEYRARNLSFEKDRVIAFAGIARAFHSLGRLTYLAGAWKEVLPLCLLWYIDKKLPALVRKENAIPNGAFPDAIWTSEIREPVAQAAPSWSWFSVPIYRFYQLNFLFNDDEIFVRSKSYLDPPLVCFDDIFWAEPMDFQFESQPPNFFPDPNGFFDFAGLQITLEMKMLPVKVNWPKDIVKQMLSIQEQTPFDDDQNLLWDPVFEYYPDNPVGRKSPPRNSVYALVAEFQVVRTAGKWNIQRRLAGLMLIPCILRPGTWTRVGVWKLRVKISNVLVNSENMVSVAQRWQNYDVVSSKWKTEAMILV